MEAKKKKTGGSKFPNELVLLIISDLTLQSLIQFRSASRTFSQLVKAAQITASRRELLAFYDEIVQSEAFVESRAIVTSLLRPFDRELYLAIIQAHSGEAYWGLPEVFKTWILEWPAKAVTSPAWPGLALSSNPCPRLLGFALSGTESLSGRLGKEEGEWRYPCLIYSVLYPSDFLREDSSLVLGLCCRTHEATVRGEAGSRWLFFGGRGVGTELEGQVGSFMDYSQVSGGIGWVEFLREGLERDTIKKASWQFQFRK